MFLPGRIAFLRHLKAPGGKGDWDAVWIGNEARPSLRTLNPTPEPKCKPMVARLLADKLEVRHGMRAGAQGQQLAVAAVCIGNEECPGSKMWLCVTCCCSVLPCAVTLASRSLPSRWGCKAEVSCLMCHCSH